MDRTTDMTKGNPFKLILTFAFPLILTNLGQHLYMIVDASIVGRGVGVKALAAVGSADWSYWLILWSVCGLTQAFATFVSRYFGDKNYYDMNKTIAMSTVLSIIIGIIFTILGLVSTRPLLNLLKTPSDIINDANIYLFTMIAGTLIVTAYNMASSILRAFGDGKSPLYAMIIAALLNVGLDLLFVIVFKLSVFGAALASVFSQFVSFVYCLYQIRKIQYIKIEKEMWKPDYKLIKDLLFFGIPLALEFIVIALGGIILQSTINLQGSTFVAGYTAVNKTYGLLEGTAISLGTAFSTFMAQNYGAGNIARVKQGLRTGIQLSIISSIIIAVTLLPTGKYILKLFININETGGIEALEIAWRYMFIMLVLLPILYLIHIYRNALQSIGISVWSMISGIAEFIVRVGMGKFLIIWLGVDTLYYIEPAAWIGALIFVIFPYYFYHNKLLK